MVHPQSQMSLEIHLPSTESRLLNDEEYTFHSSESIAISAQEPGQKRTRQWAAWTRQEQENFFSALRQVGKNFEKITCRVQSKNKNQVRHYYYRLVRRMNKLLSPGFCLDAKNSKDTNAAMLRWWSLLEKYSCTPSKLHRKPRRFKIFIEALESQLLKDRNKARRKRPCQGNTCLDTSSASSFLRRFSEQDFVGVKAGFTDAENAPKVGISRGPSNSMKRNINTNANFSKGAFSAMKTTGHRHRTGLIESAAYKRWEKAAMAGVSLVADAAEQLERVTNARVCSHQIRETATVMPTREKLKLQLFPIDEDTRLRLEKGTHNPFLELTLSARKRISSVLEHLNRKWDINTIGMGEIFLLPYNIQQDGILKCQRWTIKDADSTAADVHAAIGNPPVFRLRYGWFSGAEPGERFSNFPSASVSEGSMRLKNNSDRLVTSHTPKTTLPICSTSRLLRGSCNGSLPSEIRAQSDTLNKQKEDLPQSSEKLLSATLENNNEGSRSQQEDKADPGVRCSSDFLAVEWADSLTNISVGDLLLEASEASSSQQNALCIPQNSFSCDSFDAAVAAHNFFPQFTALSSHAPAVSLWNAEETCDEFSFKAASTSNIKGLGVSRDAVNMNSSRLADRYVEEIEERSNDNACDEAAPENPSAFSYKQEPAKDVSLTDLYWPDSLGSLGQVDLDLPYSRYQTQDLCFSESVSQSSFSRMIAGCLDAFQNGSLLGADKKKGAVEDAPPAFVDDDKLDVQD